METTALVRAGERFLPRHKNSSKSSLMKVIRFSFSPLIRRVTAPAVLVALLCLPGVSAFAAAVDLSTWSVQNYSPNAGNWVVQPGNTNVLQTFNGSPTVFLSNQSALGTEIQGKIKVTTTSDNDYMGFVLGFGAGGFSNVAADYLLIDWKQGNQDIAKGGLAVSRVTGVGANTNDFWGHVGAVDELARGATLGSTGWVDNVEYTFGFVFTPTNLQVSVNGIQQINLAGAFSDGNLGFYNFSQSSVLYSGFTQDALPPTNPPTHGVPDGGASVSLLAATLAGLAAFSHRRLLA
jgi:hypothetical protein